MRVCYQDGIYVCCIETPHELERMGAGLDGIIDSVGMRCSRNAARLRAGSEFSILETAERYDITITQEQYARLLDARIRSWYEELGHEAVMVTKTWR